MLRTFAALSLLWLVVACQPQDTIIIVTATPEPTATSITPSPTPTHTLEPTLTPYPTPTQEIALSVYTHAEGLRLRSLPSTQTGVVLAELSRNTELYTLDTGAVSRIGVRDEWLNVTTPDGLTGHVAAWLVGLEPLALFDIKPYFIHPQAMSPVHTLRTSWAGDGERIQVQREGACFWFVKGHIPQNANYEAFVLINGGIYRTYDTSPFENALYTVQANNKPLLWLPAQMAIGDSVLFPMVAHWYRKSDGSPYVPFGAPSNIIPFGHIIELVAHHETWQSKYGVTLNDVIEVRSYFPSGQPFERYWFSADSRASGLVGWKSETSTHESYISAVLAPNTPNMQRERVGWLQLPYGCGA